MLRAVEITFGTSKLAKTCNSMRQMVREFGDESATKLGMRLQAMEAVECLADLFTLPQCRCHPLKGDRGGQFAVDLKHPFRLVFEPRHNPMPLTDEGGIDLTQVTAVEVLAVEDYHR